ncbi:MAG: hypothetical protein A2Z04_00230 [Chloroflexi bacterium RBG_16_57_9]|nr:MAG: hypothetical protein A2Z04_00230 [Chloroflexi bacterium RBG_16_57_9]
MKIFGVAWFRFVQFGFYLLYNPLAWAYDGVSFLVSQGDWRRWTQAALPHVHGPWVLEIGCGPGHLLGDLAAAGYQVTGLDLSPAMIRRANRNLRRRDLFAHLVRGQAPHLPFADGMLDTVVMTFPSSYAVQPETIAELGRVLGPTGRFVLVDGPRLTGRDPWSRLLNLAFAFTSRPVDVPKVRSLVKAAVSHTRPARPFQVDVHQVSLKSSSVQVIVAQKVSRPARSTRPRGSESLNFGNGA